MTTSPTVWRRWLARQMTAKRLERGLSQREVATQLRCTVTKVSYGENAERAFRARDLTEILLPLYGVPEEEWPTYIEACNLSRRRGWWHDYDEEIVPDWYSYYLGLEQGASTIRGFTMQVVPGLVQTRRYAASIMAAEASALGPEDAAGRLDVRMRRQEILQRFPTPPSVHFVLDEAVLRRRVGGPDIMAEQLERLVELADRPNVTLQVLPFDSGYFFDGSGEPIILGFPWPDDPGLVYIEGRLSGECLESSHEVEDFVAAFNLVRHAALDPLASLEMMKEICEAHR
jgi:transcriptional regulator with XRE-family HTH domain